MYYIKPLLLFSVILLTVSCGGSSGDATSSKDLTGVWRLEFNNILYLLVQNNSSVTIKVCDSEDPFTLIESSGSLGVGGTDLFKINSATQLEISSGFLVGEKLNKVNNDPSFSSGSVTVRSSNISDLSSTTDVCAYRETDDIYNIISAPYESGYLELNIAVYPMTTGRFSIPSDVSISVESPLLPDNVVFDSSGEVDVLEYSTTKFRADFKFTASDGNAYTGSVDVDL